MNDLSPLGDGLFYPKEKEELTSLLNDLLSQAPDPEESTDCIVTPHAAYTYSGKHMATAFNALKNGPKAAPERIIILAPLHREAEPGIYLPPAGGIELPNGRINFDTQGIELLKDKNFFSYWDVPFLEEPAIELQLPFVLRLFPGIPVLPVYANVEKKKVQKALADGLLLLPDSLIIITTNLTGFKKREESRLLADEFLSSVGNDSIEDNSSKSDHKQFDPDSWKANRKGGLPKPCGLELLSAFWLYSAKKYPDSAPHIKILSSGPDTPGPEEISSAETVSVDDKCAYYAGFGIFMESDV